MPLRHTLTSLYGGTGTLEMSGDGTQHTSTVVSIRSSKSSEIVAMLREAIEYLGAGSDTRTDDDLTLRLVQQQRDQATARAEKAERERDEARETIIRLREEMEDHDCIRDAAVIREPRALTPEDLDDSALYRARHAAAAVTPESWWGGREWRDYVRDILTAALTKPQRPEGAEELQRALILAWDYSDTPEGLADAMASEGFRVTTEGGEER